MSNIVLCSVSDVVTDNIVPIRSVRVSYCYCMTTPIDMTHAGPAGLRASMHRLGKFTQDGDYSARPSMPTAPLTIAEARPDVPRARTLIGTPLLFAFV